MDHISWHASRLGEELAKGTYRTQALAYCPHQSLGKQVCAWKTPISEYSLGSFLPAARSNGPGTHRLRLRLFPVGGFHALPGLFAVPWSSEHLIGLLSPSCRAYRTGRHMGDQVFLPSLLPGI